MSVCVCAVAAAGPAVEGWMAHVCRLPDAEACSVLGARSMCLSLSPHTYTHTYTQAHAYTDGSRSHYTHTRLAACITRLGEKKREGETGREGGWQRGNGQRGGGNTRRLQRDGGQKHKKKISAMGT